MRNNIKQIFEDEDFVKRNKWFFEADWKNIEIEMDGGEKQEHLPAKNVERQ